MFIRITLSLLLISYSRIFAAITPALAPSASRFQADRPVVSSRSDATLTRLSGTGSVAYLLTPPAASTPLPLLDVNFCGECLPFDRGSVVDRWKHVFTLFRNSTNDADLGKLHDKADVFFPIIAPILAKYDIPEDFRYVPMAESGLNPKAVSPAGAAGYWQLMPGTARALGLRVGKGVDERFDVKKSTEAACKYLRQLYSKLGSWSLVAAAYNAGPGHINNQLKRNPNSDYFRLNLPRETRYYLFRILVYKEVFSRPADYSTFLS